ncbi:MAG: hypothetical protein EBE86_004065 [Hormoscilla sp. GUM202]|nr:hypothetical protein [Hormoscilla sp. GUM202]
MSWKSVPQRVSAISTSTFGVEKHRVSGTARVRYDRIFHGPMRSPGLVTDRSSLNPQFFFPTCIFQTSNWRCHHPLISSCHPTAAKKEFAIGPRPVRKIEKSGVRFS